MTVQSEHGDETVESFRILRNTANISVSYNLTNLMVVPFNLLIVIRLLLSLPFFLLSFFVSSFRLLQVLRGWLGR